MTTKKWGHNELAHDLAEHLRQNTARICWEDMQLGPAGTCRPDVYSIAHSYSKFCPVVYEVKVSVSDFRADVTAGKYTKYFNYAGGVVFAVPEGMLKKSDIPDGCGLMIRKETGWHTLKGPTMRQIDTLPRDASKSDREKLNRMLEEMFEDSDMWLTSESPTVRQHG